MRKREFPHTEPNGVLPISTTISLVRVAVGINSDQAICGVLPMTICTAIVSPNARAMARMIEVRMPGAAAGRMTPVIVCQRVTPRASDPSSRARGTERGRHPSCRY
jgi:hypothetical protein